MRTTTITTTATAAATIPIYGDTNGFLDPRRHVGIGADAPAGCHGGKSAAAGVFRLDQVHHQGFLRGPVCRKLGRSREISGDLRWFPES